MKKWRPTQERGQPKICWGRVRFYTVPLEEAHYRDILGREQKKWRKMLFLSLSPTASEKRGRVHGDTVVPGHSRREGCERGKRVVNSASVVSFLFKPRPYLPFATCTELGASVTSATKDAQSDRVAGED